MSEEKDKNKSIPDQNSEIRVKNQKNGVIDDGSNKIPVNEPKLDADITLNDSELDATVSEEIESHKAIKDSKTIETVDIDEERDLRTIQKNLIEGALYAAGSPLDIEEIATKLELPKKLVEDLIQELAYEYLDRSSALVIAQVGERYQMQLRPEYTESISKFTKGGAIAEKYLRTLTIIALKQPILKSILVKIRGTGAYEHVKYLLDNELITAEKKGRTSELMTTDKYADMFGLPKNREELKRTMISQLGLDEGKD
ncbi:MAG: SMC-Scp complex subunit ScpB [Promethearchaeota archaeon]|nr:MAG: SMC-Scp complex subunit ScpB [Candidatus Lokiarchaeota archaeon]